MRKTRDTYHHGNLAESLLEAVDQIATQFGLEAVTLRGCAKRVGVSPSSAFRHYADKRALLTAFATRALQQLSAVMARAESTANNSGGNPFMAVGLAYVEFAIDKPAFFRAMWREEAIYSHDLDYSNAADELGGHLAGGFARTLADQDPESLSPQELLAWSSVHGLAGLLIDGPVARQQSRAQKLELACETLRALGPALLSARGGPEEPVPAI